METWKILVALGGLLALVAGLSSALTGIPMAERLFNFSPVSGDIVKVLGVIGIIGGLLALYGAGKGDPRMGLAGGVLGLLAPCGLALLAVVGGFLGMRSK